MQYQSPLIEGQFLNRYKRFFSDVEIIENGKHKKVVAHVANTGSLRGICDTSTPCRLAYHNNPERKLKYSLEQIQLDTSWVGVNTRIANDLVAEAFEIKLLKHWHHLVDMQREFKLSKETRLDFRFIDAKNRLHYVEVKSVSMAVGKTAQFPDAPTTRGQKHLKELIELVKAGHSAEIFFVVQRTDAREFSPAEQIDAKYAELLLLAKRSGVHISAHTVELSETAAKLASKPLKIKL